MRRSFLKGMKMPKEEMVSQVQSPEFQEKLKQKLHKLKGDNGYCVAEGCGGRIVKSVLGISSASGYIYSLPYCEKCKRRYTFASGHIPAVGYDQLQKTLSMTFNL